MCTDQALSHCLLEVHCQGQGRGWVPLVDRSELQAQSYSCAIIACWRSLLEPHLSWVTRQLRDCRQARPMIKGALNRERGYTSTIPRYYACSIPDDQLETKEAINSQNP
jgi:hypothetical protein